MTEISEQILTQLQVDLVTDALSKSKMSSSHLKLYQAGPAHYNYTNFPFPHVDINFDSLPMPLKARVVEVCTKLNESKGNNLEIISPPDSPVRRSLCDSIVSGTFESYLRSCIEAIGGYSHENFIQEARRHSIEILEWHHSARSGIKLRCQFMPRVNPTASMNLGRWSFFHPTWTDLSRFCHISRHSGQEALNRIMELTWMETLVTAEETQGEDAILEIAEANALALTLGTGMPIILEDLNIETTPWKFAPDRPNVMLMKMATPSWTHPSVAASVRFHASFLLRRKKDDPFTENITIAELQRVQNWHSILDNAPEAIFSLQNILRGSWGILGSYYAPTARRRSTSLTGIFDFISGMEGLNSNCKPTDKNGFKTKAYETFCSVWSTLWEKQLAKASSGATTGDLARIDTKDALRRLYNLRSDIAHSDTSNLALNLKNTKCAFGDSFNPKQYDPTSTGVCIVQRIFPILDLFEQDQDILKNLINGIAPN